MDVEGREFGRRKGGVTLKASGEDINLHVTSWKAGKISAVLQGPVKEGLRYGLIVKTSAGESDAEGADACASAVRASAPAAAEAERGRPQLSFRRPSRTSPEPVITAVIPSGGCLRQGGAVEIKGRDFGRERGAVELVTLGKNIALQVKSWSAVKISAVLGEPIMKGRTYGLMVSTAAERNSTGSVEACTAEKESAGASLSRVAEDRQRPGDPDAAPMEAQPSDSTPEVFQKPVYVALEVRHFSKDFEKWSDSITINEPQTLTFRWNTNSLAAAAAAWQVRGFEGAGLSKGRPKVIASGPLPQVSSSPTMFQIPFTGFIPQWPPVAPGVYNYWVKIALEDGQGNEVPLIAGAWVKVSYRAPGETTVFNICSGDSQCPTGYFCRETDGTCLELEYSCGEGFLNMHLIVANDGTSVDCRPYICYMEGATGLPLCYNVCTSNGHCAAGFRCNSQGICEQYMCRLDDPNCPPGFTCVPEEGKEGLGNCLLQ